ncbi:MAG: DUF2169 domain-containing protein, partial [Desulfobulbaceae bacterium]|nr:DUF2169 domain-containing protein [Desulfobulbaceae bacterium]
MKIYRPLQLSFNHRVLEQNRKFYFTASATLGINLQSGESLLDFDALKDGFECMGDNPLPDMGMPKPCGEFLVSGSFFPPDKKEVRGGEVKVRLGRQEKSLHIVGPRKWQNGLATSPEPFTSMPIDYEHAFGGEGFEKNPAGIGFKDGLLPCIEDPKQMVGSPADRPEPVGLVPQDVMLPQRMRYQGTCDDSYLEKYFPGYPADLDWRFFLCAPKDQWIKEYYHGNEEFALFHMHPEIAAIKGRLPGLYARCFINHTIKSSEPGFSELLLNLDTIWFFPEKLMAWLIWHGSTEVADDEAEEISHVLLAYEDRADQPRSHEQYRAALDLRMTSDDALLYNLNTEDLIPIGHKCAMELLQERAMEESGESALGKNLDAKAVDLKKEADEKVEEAIQGAEKQLAEVDIPDEVKAQMSDEVKAKMPGEGFDIRRMMEEPPEATPDPDVEALNRKLESILPGITTGDPKKLELKKFSFDKIDQINEAVGDFAGKKEQEAIEMASKEIGKAKEQVKEQITNLDKQIEEAKKIPSPEGLEQIIQLEDAKKKIDESLQAFDELDLDGAAKKKAPLPRVDKEELEAALAETKAQTKQIDPQVMAAMQHVQTMKQMGIEDETTKDLEKQIKDALATSTKQVDEALAEAEKGIDEAEKGFKEGYSMGAHFMAEGLSPHKESEEDVKKRFLEAVANGENVAEGDWACLDLSGENLDGIDLSGAFLE